MVLHLLLLLQLSQWLWLLFLAILLLLFEILLFLFLQLQLKKCFDIVIGIAALSSVIIVSQFRFCDWLIDFLEVPCAGASQMLRLLLLLGFLWLLLSSYWWISRYIRVRLRFFVGINTNTNQLGIGSSQHAHKLRIAEILFLPLRWVVFCALFTWNPF